MVEAEAEEVDNAVETVGQENGAEEEGVVGEDLVAEHLKDAVDGSLRLKRLLSRDNDSANPLKKQKFEHIIGPLETLKVNELMSKWVTNCPVIRHVLEQIEMVELQGMEKASYNPQYFAFDKNDPQGKRAYDILQRHVVEVREKTFLPGGKQDAIQCFIHRWKFDADGQKVIRTLSHKDLRYVIENYNVTSSLADVIGAASGSTVEDENATVAVLPDVPGLSIWGRFGRMELIDPLADSAVFGDANLTFSLKLAKHRSALGHVGRVIATTFEDLETLQMRYSEINESIDTLEKHFAEVHHCVDCTRIAVDRKFEGMEGAFGAVYYNFPHSGAIQGFFDGHPVVNWRHENLMRLFFRALRTFMKPGGIVKVASNQNAVGVRYIYIVGGGIENEFEHVETIPFMEWNLHRYGRSYGDKRDSHRRPDAVNNQSYNAQAAHMDMVYCFRYKPSGDKLPPQFVRRPPTLNTLMACTDGPFRALGVDAKKKLANSLHTRFVTECGGTHVG